MPVFRLLLVAVGLFIAASSGLATTFVVPEDRELIDRAEAIVAGRVIDTAQRLSDGIVVTDIRVALDERIKGAPASDIITIVEDGGILGERGNWVYGTPVYQAGERVLLFLDRNRRGELKTANMLLGKFHFTSSKSGQRLLLRGSPDHAVFGINESGVEHRELPRLEDGFLSYVRSVVRGEPRAVSYFTDAELQREFESRLQARTSSHVPASSYVMNFTPRFNNGASKTIPTNLNGAPATRDWVGSAQRGAAAWTNDGGSTIGYSVSGSTTATFNQSDSTDVIIFNVPPSEFGGAIGIGGWNSSGSHTFAGETWATIAFIDVKISSNASTTAQGVIDAIVCHELGHTLGFRHSNEGTPNSSDAVMNSVINRSSASLGSWDRDAASHVYGSGAPPPCVPASVTGGPSAFPSTITAGQSSTLSVTGGGTDPLTYSWFRGSVGDTSSPAGSGSSIVVSPSSTTSYWVRITNSCNTSGANSSAVTVTVNAAVCTPAGVSSGPFASPPTISAGQLTTLSVQPSGSSPFSFQWFLGNPGNTSTLVGTTQNIVIGPSATSTYWVRVSNSCNTSGTNSGGVTVTVVPGNGCSPPAIASGPSSQTIAAGQTATLSVSVAGSTPFTFQWYQGNSGNTSTPVGTNSSTLSVTPSATTSYWVQVRNSCSAGVNSPAATVTVTAPSCTAPPVITQQPQPRTITAGQTATLSVAATGGGLSYQWYTVVGTSFVAVSGANGATFVTPALSATTSYLVQVTNSCGAPANSNIVPVTVLATCGSGNLCFHGGRFRVSLFATDPATGKTANGETIIENDIFGYFSLPGLTNDSSNREVFVKVVGPVNGIYWVFYGGLTSFEYRLTVTDTSTGQVKVYTKAPNVPNGGFDLGSGVPAESCPASAPPVVRPSVLPSGCSAGPNQLCLANRFIVRVFARDNVSGLSGFGEANTTTDVFGYYSLAALTNDPSNAEVFVKILDARTVNGKYWLFYGGLTSFEYTISITDSQTGQVREYTKRQNSACGGFDLSLF